MSGLWAEAEFAFPPAGLDAFLLWAAGLGASDVTFQTGAPAFVEVDGVLRRATGAVLDGMVMGALCARIFDNTADGILRSGRAIDCSYAVASGKRRFRRFRCNLSPVLADQRFGINLTMRVLPDAPPTFAELGIEVEIAAAWELCRGLTLVTGVPGSGKSTLLAAGTRHLLEGGAGRVQSYEAPIEFVFDGIGGDGALMSSSEIPRHFPSFAEGLRASLRRRPAAVIVGEARDRETVEAAVRAADFGIAVFATAHTIGVAAAVRRLLAEFPAQERQERGAALIDVMTLVVTQMLLANPQGGRTAIREWLAFDGALKAALLEAPQERWPGLMTQALQRTGNDLATAAERALREGRIGETDLRRVMAAARAVPPQGAKTTMESWQ
ncbi:MAG: ATPase, T2SS/T4P/T4SS family [Alphaproteobacteria bacterium]|nr:ATPase, T2SS/T4P/T4SS family [Alphaproteobacteria bacterium]